MYDMSGCCAPAMDRSAMLDHYCRMYPSVAMDFFPHVQAVADEMDDADTPFMPRERFDAMVDRVMSRMDDDWMDEDEDFDPDRRDPEFRFPRRFPRRFRRRFHRRRLARGLVSALLIGELLRRRRFFRI